MKTSIQLLLGTLVIFSCEAFAKRACYQLLQTNAAVETTFQPAQLEAVEGWLKRIASTDYPKWLRAQSGYREFLEKNEVSDVSLAESDYLLWPARYVLAKWHEWNKVSAQQRAMARALEFSKIRPKAEDGVQVIAGQVSTQQLRELSRANLKRMLSRLEELHPSPALSESQQTWIRQTVARFQTIFLRPREAPGVSDSEPLLSARQMKILGFESNSFYSQLVDTSPSLGFSLIAVDSKFDPPHTYPGLMSIDSFNLNAEFAAQEGFVLPDFVSANSMLKFFDQWEPKANESVFRANRFYLPGTIESYQQFREHLTLANEDQIFTRPYEQLAPLRTRLIHYVLSAEDARAFFRAAYATYLASRLQSQPGDVVAIEKTLGQPGGLQLLFRTAVLPWIGLDKNPSLRIPVSVSPAQFSVLRVEAKSPRWDSQTPFHRGHMVDHRAMP